MPDAALFVDCLREVVHRQPDRPAVVVNGQVTFTYQGLWAAAGSVARQLQIRGIGREAVVAVQLPRSAELIAALVGIWRAGAAYLPLDPQLPEDRINFMLKDASVRAVIARQPSEYSSGDFRPEVLLADDKLFAGESQCDLPSRASGDLAYIIYTSGTTGRPKGVAVEQRGILGLLAAQIRAFEVGPEARVYFLLSPSFDASLSDIGTTLLSGAALCVETDQEGPRGASISPQDLVAIFAKRRITHVDLPPALLSVMNPGDAPPSLKTIVIGGEPCSTQAVRAWSRRFRVVNVYGPTEATVCTSLCVCDERWSRPLLGQPIDGVRYRLEPVKESDGESGVGELLIAGNCLARCYVNLPELTAERFVSIAGERWYRTGDLVRQDVDGEYVFLGRIDRQVKIRGRRIELMEIEAVMASCPNVACCAVVAHSIGASSARSVFVAFVQPAERSVTLDLPEVRAHLKRSLPDWMLPQRTEILDKIPVTASGKVDLAALQTLPLAKPAAELPDCTPLERELLAIWKRVLPGVVAGPHDDFFELGGDSLSLLEMLALAETRGLAIPPAVAVAQRTVVGICAEIQRDAGHARSQSKSAEELREDILGDADELRWLVHVQNVSRGAQAPHKILLTGATGFLGCHVLGELLRRTDHRIVCLLRAPDESSARFRLRSAIHEQRLPIDERDLARVEVVLGDVAIRNAGLSCDYWSELAETAAAIYHCAARVHVMEPYAALRGVNVQGVYEMVRLAAQGFPKQLHYASTLSVFVGSDRGQGRMLESDDLTGTKEVYGGYAQSKWAAEVLVREAQLPNGRAKVFRFGLLPFDARTGVVPPRDLLTLAIRGLVRLGCIPCDAPDLRMDLTPVDYAAATMVYLSLLPSADDRQGCSTYHVASPSGVSLRQLLSCLRALRPELAEVNADEFRQRVAQSPHALEAAACLGLCRWAASDGDWRRYRTLDLFPATDVIFDISRTQSALRGSGIACPDADDSLVTRYLQRVLQRA